MQISKQYRYFDDICDTIKTIMIEDINNSYGTKTSLGYKGENHQRKNTIDMQIRSNLHK